MATALLQPTTATEPNLQDPSELKQAFQLFSQMSQQLTESYAFLESKVEHLSGELATVSEQRMQELAEKERLADRLQSLLTLLPAGVLLLDQHGVVSQSNPAADELLLELSGEQCLVGSYWRQLIQRCFKPRGDDGHEISLVDGRRVQLRTTPMSDGPGQIILLTDMTETRALQSELSRHQRLSAMGKMVASLAHQIRTPLSAATLYAGHLNADQLDEKLRVRFANKLTERLQHLESQVRDMLIFARGEAPLNDDISTGDLVSAFKAAMEVPVQQHQATVAFDIGCSLTQRLVCNKDALISALMNLINNALESGEHPIELSVHMRMSDEQTLVIHIDDNGPGLNAEQKEKYLEPFFTTKSNGTGLGLAVVQAVVNAHQGTFDCNDSALGGLSAQLTLPILYGVNSPNKTHQ